MSSEISVWEKPTNASGLEHLAKSMTNRVASALPVFLAGSQNRLLAAMVTETRRNPALLECTPKSLFGAVIQAGQLGLTIGGPLGEAYLIPFGRKGSAKEATLIVGYKGLIQLMHRSDKLKRITPGIVREGDDFAVRRGTSQRIDHVPIRNNRSPVTDYYVTVSLVNGGDDFETFTYEDAIAWRDRFATTRNAPQFVRDKSPWYDMEHGFHEQACKTLIRKLSKRLPLSADVARAAQLEDDAEAERPQQLGAGLELEEPNEPLPSRAEDLRERLEQTRRGSGPNGEYLHGVDDPAHAPQAG